VTQFCVPTPCVEEICSGQAYCQAGIVGQPCLDLSNCATYNCVNGLCQDVQVGGKCFQNPSCTSQNCFAQICQANSVGPCVTASDCTSKNCGPDGHCQGPTGPPGPPGSCSSCPPVHYGTACFGLSVYHPTSGTNVTFDCSQPPTGFTGAFVLVEENVQCAPGYSLQVSPPPPSVVTSGPPPVKVTYSCSLNSQTANVIYARGLCCPF